jgi:polyisoprenoid-binding protein YceI
MQDRRTSGNNNPLTHLARAALLLLAALAASAQAPRGSQWRADPARSTLRIELGKSGWLRAFGDEHLIAASEYECRAEFDAAAPEGGKVELSIAARRLKVLDPQLSAEKRREVQEKMEGPEVLDLARFATIRFVSRRVTAQGADRWRVDGELRIREAARNVEFTLTLLPETGGYRARGEAAVRMSAYGITPPSAGGGSVKVKDEMKIVFDLLLVPVKN